MTFDEYQAQAITTDTSNGVFEGVAHPSFIDKVLGLVGESGEFAEKVKKILRDENGELSDEKRAELVKELGDVLWYVSAVAHYLDKPLSELAHDNLQKVLSRKQRGTTSGSGDNR